MQIASSLAPMPDMTQVRGSRRRTKAIPLFSEANPVVSLNGAPRKETTGIVCCEQSNATHTVYYGSYSPSSRTRLICQAGEPSGQTASKNGDIKASADMPKPLTMLEISIEHRAPWIQSKGRGATIRLVQDYHSKLVVGENTAVCASKCKPGDGRLGDVKRKAARKLIWHVSYTLPGYACGGGTWRGGDTLGPNRQDELHVSVDARCYYY